MWFAGLLIGAILGGLSSSPLGSIVGAAIGLVAGLIYSDRNKNKAGLEQRVAVLEQRVAALSAQLSARPPFATETKTMAEHASTDHAVAPSAQPAVARAPASSQDIIASNDLPIRKPASVSVDMPHQPETGSPPVASTTATAQWFSKLLSGNILAKIGVIILFFGIASGLKLAVDMGLFPISVRLMLGALAAVTMSIFGYHRAQRTEHRMFGQALQGGGLGILYLLVYFMLARYQIVGETLAFVLFTLIGVGCVLLAARQDSRSLAMLGISGAFLSPVMAAHSGGSQITLFSYFLLLNTFIICVNWFKGWRVLNMSGFIFTLVIGMNWAFHAYQPGDFPVSEIFLILFFLLYSATPVLFNLFNAPGRLSWGDGMLLYGTPLAAAALQNHMLHGQDTTLAWNACVAGTYYLMLWRAIYRKPDESTVWLEKSLLAVAIGFFTLAIPLAFDTQLTSAFWTLEGFGVLYLGVKQDRFLARLSGSALQMLAGLYFMVHSHELTRALPVFNDWYVGCVIVVVAAFASALLLQRTAGKTNGTEMTVAFAARMDTSELAIPFLYWGLLWWFAAGFSEIDHFAPVLHKMALWLTLCLFSFAFVEWLGSRRDWHAMRLTSALLLPAVLIAAFDGHLIQGHALYGNMSMLIPLAILAHYWLLYRHDRDAVASARKLRHACSYWLLIVLAGSELVWVAQRLASGNTLWPWLAWGSVGALGIIGSLRGLQRECWPFAPHRSLYLDTLQAPVALLLGAWLIYGNLTHSGGGSGIPYLPVLNPFDLAQLLAMYAIWNWFKASQIRMLPGLYGIAFLWISAEAARLTHHWGGVPFDQHRMLDSATFQAGLSMLWTAIAMSVMVYASHSRRRSLWFNGFALLAIVGIKLMLIDLSNKGTALWTASLIAIALLIIAASYFSPAPPKEASPEK